MVGASFITTLLKFLAESKGKSNSLTAPFLLHPALQNIDNHYSNYITDFFVVTMRYINLLLPLPLPLAISY